MTIIEIHQLHFFHEVKDFFAKLDVKMKMRNIYTDSYSVLYGCLCSQKISPRPEPIGKSFGWAVVPYAGPSSPSYIQSHLSLHIAPTLSLKKVNSLIATRINTLTRQGGTYPAVFFTFRKFPGEELFCALHYCHIFKEGPPENVFDQNDEVAQPADVTQSAIPEAEVAIKLAPAVFTAVNQAEDIEFV